MQPGFSGLAQWGYERSSSFSLLDCNNTNQVHPLSPFLVKATFTSYAKVSEQNYGGRLLFLIFIIMPKIIQTCEENWQDLASRKKSTVQPTRISQLAPTDPHHYVKKLRSVFVPSL